MYILNKLIARLLSSLSVFITEVMSSLRFLSISVSVSISIASSVVVCACLALSLSSSAVIVRCLCLSSPIRSSPSPFFVVTGLVGPIRSVCNRSCVLAEVRCLAALFYHHPVVVRSLISDGCLFVRHFSTSLSLFRPSTPAGFPAAVRPLRPSFMSLSNRTIIQFPVVIFALLPFWQLILWPSSSVFAVSIGPV